MLITYMYVSLNSTIWLFRFHRLKLYWLFWSTLNSWSSSLYESYLCNNTSHANSCSSALRWFSLLISSTLIWQAILSLWCITWLCWGNVVLKRCWKSSGRLAGTPTAAQSLQRMPSAAGSSWRSPAWSYIAPHSTCSKRFRIGKE